ncbi:MAG: hypothetical protein ABSA11_00275 [Candidatus Bathyarchaeia archaeon]
MPLRLGKTNKKVILAIVFIALFTVSVAAVLFRSAPASQSLVGYVNVSRSESYWSNKTGNTTDSRYLIDYGIAVIQDTPTVTIHDKTDPGLTQIPIDQDTTNIQVSYDSTTGDITVVATGLKTKDEVFGQAAFKMDPVDIFSVSEAPHTIVNPADIYWGDKATVNITITPFRVAKTANVTEVGVYSWFTNAVTDISDVSTAPPAVCDPPAYQAIWQYKNPTTFNYTAHSAKYTIQLPSIQQGGDILLRTWVEARYSTPLRMAVDGTIDGANGLFFKVDSSISYQYEHIILTRKVG